MRSDIENQHKHRSDISDGRDRKMNLITLKIQSFQLNIYILRCTMCTYVD